MIVVVVVVVVFIVVVVVVVLLLLFIFGEWNFLTNGILELTADLGTRRNHSTKTSRVNYFMLT